MADRVKKLERELGLPAGRVPFEVDTRNIAHRVERVLSAQEQERKMYMRHKMRLAAALTAGVVAVTGTALAAGPAISEALQGVLGEFAPYVQVQEGAVESAGIRVKALAALTDDLCARVYLEVTDVTGDRLEQAEINGNLEVKLEGETSWVSGCRVVDYDEETRTALVCVEKNAGTFFPDELEGTVVLNGIQPGYHRFNSEELPVEAVPDRLLRTRQLSSGESVLEAGQNPVELAQGDGVAVSSMGFGDDGRFHVLSVFPEGAMEKGIATVSVYAKASGEEAWSRLLRTVEGVCFTEKGRVYYDVSYEAELSQRKELDSMSGVYGVYATSEPLKGRWELPVKLRRVEIVTSPLQGLIDHNTLAELRLSSMGVVLVSTSQDWTQIGGYPLTVFLADGTSLHPKAGIHGHQGEGVNLARWEFDRPMEVEDITGVALGCWMIPVENGTAGEGYWLSQLPQ